MERARLLRTAPLPGDLNPIEKGYPILAGRGHQLVAYPLRQVEEAAIVAAVQVHLVATADVLCGAACVAVLDLPRLSAALHGALYV